MHSDSDGKRVQQLAMTSKDDTEMVEMVAQGGAGDAQHDIQSHDKKRWYYFGERTKMVPAESPEDADEIPLASANIFSRLTFGWVSPIMRIGFKRPLEDTDLWKMDASRQSYGLSVKFLDNLERRQLRAAEWNAQLATARPPVAKRIIWIIQAMKNLSDYYAEFGPGDSYTARLETLQAEWRARDGREHASIGWSLIDTFPEIKYIGIWRALSDGALVGIPLIVKQIIEYAQEVDDASHAGSSTPGPGRGIALAIGIFLLNMMSVLALQQAFIRAEGAGVLVRATLIQSIYQRTFQMSVGAKAKIPDGRLLTHLSADVSRVDRSLKHLHCIWTAPINLVVVLILLCLQIGPSGLVGFMFLLLTIPAQAWILKYCIKVRGKVVSFTESRTKLLQSILPHMSIIKMFTYENPYLDRIYDVRDKEMHDLRILHFIQALLTAVAMCSPAIASVFGFVMYSSLNPQFDPAIIFSALMYFNYLRPPLVLLPQALSAGADALNAMHRLSTVFEAEVLETQVVINYNLKAAVNVEHASFCWATIQDPSTEDESHSEESRAEPFAIRELSMSIPRGQLVAIVGPVGSGKSSLLQGLLGEMRSIGAVEFGGRLGYCQQSSFIQNATIRSNILFGQPWDEARYWRAIDAASLAQDLEILADGDMTEIGERGINISGGQKQRINIARALYNDADIILMDDPLSAVDAHVGRALFNNAILGLRRAGKTVVLVTHALHLLPQVDYIYTMENGRVVEEGQYTALMAANGAFTQLMGEFGGAQDDDDGKGGTKDVTAVEIDGEHELLGKGSDAKESKPAGVGNEIGRLMLAEHRKTGSVGYGPYAAFLKSGGVLWVVFAIVMTTLLQGAQVMGSVWLTYWQKDAFNADVNFYQGIYAAFGIASAALTLFAGMAITCMSIHASYVLFTNMLRHVWFSPMSFFDTVPLGRLMGVFGKDTDSLDNDLPEMWTYAMMFAAQLIGAIIITTVNFPYYPAIVVPVAFGYAYLTYYYRKTAREVRRIDSLLRSRLYAHFSESISGLSTIRAYGEQRRFIQQNADLVDLQNRAYFMTYAASEWLDTRYGLLASMLIFAMALMCALGAKTVGASTVGLVLTYMSQTTAALSSLGAVSAELESHMNSVERILYYSGDQIAQEAPYEIEKTEPKGWPSQGAIELQNVVMAYRPGLAPVLKGVSVNIRPGQRVGIIGRTGAGKTSITLALYRLVEITSGKILIDGVDVQTLGLKTLRSSIAVIPQDPVLFNGTLRSNLDPFDSCSDQELYHALERASLRSDTWSCEAANGAQKFTLDMSIDDGGSNLSVGQRSLVSLARALLKKNARIIVMDEATASVDLETDAKIQHVIRQEHRLGGQTILCIAHRLRTVIGWDRILVMDAGEVRGFASPLELYARQDDGGLFRDMCDQSSITKEEIIRATMENRVEAEVGGDGDVDIL